MLNKITDYFKGVWRELTKVTWPSRKEVLNHTLIVVAVCVFATAFISGVDLGLSKAVEYFISLK